MNPIAIILPHRESFSPLSAGAVSMVVQRLAAAPSRYPSLVIGPLPAGGTFPGITFHPVAVPRWLPLSVTQSYALAVSMVVSRLPPGPIEVHNKPDVAAWLALRFPRRPVLLHLHNDPRTMRGARSPGARVRLLRRLAAVTAVSGAVAAAFMEGLPHAGRGIAVIHNALDMAAVPTPVPMERRARVLLFAGRTVPDKAPDAFVAACALALPHLPGWRAEVIGADGFATGATDTPFIRALRPAAAAAGVTLLGYRTHRDVLLAMAQAAIVAVPSRWAEPFGMTALEAMACGAALVCSRRGGLDEVVGEACLAIDPDDPAGFAAALIRLAGDPALRDSLSAAGQVRARALFGIEAAIARVDAVRDAAYCGG